MSTTIRAARAPYAADASTPHRCCGCCCNTKTAVLVVNIISLVSSVIFVLAFIFAFFLGGKVTDGLQAASEQEIDDDIAQQDVEDLQASLQKGLDAVAEAAPWMFAPVIILSAAFLMGIYGSVSIKVWPVAIALIAHAVNCCISLVFLQITEAIVAGFFAYPHIVFILEIRRGIFTSTHDVGQVVDDVLPSIEAVTVTAKARSDSHEREKSEGIV